MKLADFAPDYLAICAGSRIKNTPQTIGNKERNLRPFLARFGDRDLTEITAGQILRLVDELERTYKPGTLQQMTNTLRHLFKVADEYEEFPADQDPPKVPRIKPGVKLEYYTPTDHPRILRAARCPEDALCCALLLYCGLRQGEARGVTYSSIQGDFLLINQQRRRDDTIGPTKTRRSRRVPCPAQVSDAIRALPAEGKGRFLLDYGHSWWDQSIRRTLGRASVQLWRDEDGVTAPVDRQGSCHTMRHSYAVRLVHKGVPLRVVGQWMGHNKTETTEGYAHHAPETDEKWAHLAEG